MKTVKNNLLIVTDLGRLQAYKVALTPKRTPLLEPLEEVVLEGAHRRVIETVTDLAVRHVGPTQKTWGAPITDDHNLKLETRRRLIRRIAEHIQRLVQRSDCEAYWLAAPKEINRQIVDQLDTDVRSRMKKNVGADLIKVDKSDVMGYFA